MLKILSIDAWRDPDGWTWNNHFKVGEISEADAEKLDTPRKVCAYLRREGYLSAASAGRVSVDMGDCYVDHFVEVRAKGTRKPLFAISAIH